MKKLILSFTLLAGIGFSSNAQNVNIPDANFKAYLVGNTSINTNFDSEIQLTEAQSFTGNIEIGNFSISDLTGIAAFTSITELICYQNQLTTLDLSANLALTKVRCHSNELTTLNLGPNTVLNELWCYTNQLSTLDVSANTGLTILFCNENNISTIDISENISLIEFYCFNNELTILDVSLNAALVKLHCNNNLLTTLKVDNGNNVNFTQFIAQANPDLTCIEVDNASYSTSTWNGANFIFDIGTSFSENCAASANINTTESNVVLNVSPNPARTHLMITTEDQIESISIYNLMGDLVQYETEAAFSVEGLASGIYLINVLSDSGLLQTRFVKE